MDEKIFSKYFKAFGDRSRIRILRLLASREADIVNNRRDGQQVFYSLNKTSVSNCCVGFCDCLVVPVTASRKKTKKK